MSSPLDNFLLGNLTKFEEAVNQHKNELESILKTVAEGVKMTIEDIEVHGNITSEEVRSVSSMVGKGVPLYHALLATVHQNEMEKFKRMNFNVLRNKTELARCFFADMVLIMTQGRSIGETNIYIPSILTKSYGYIHNPENVKRFLYGSCFLKFNIEPLYALANALNFGKIGNRLGLGIAGTRYIQASLMMYCPNLEEDKARNALAIMRALNIIEDKEKLHSLRRTRDFTNVFGSINHVFFYIYTQYCDPQYKDFLKKNKSIYGNLIPGSQFINYLKWDKNAIANYIYNSNNNNDQKRIDFINKVDEEMRKINERPFLIRNVSMGQFEDDSNNGSGEISDIVT